MMNELRFILVGYLNNKGCAVKDLKDDKVEYLSRRELFEYADKVGIQGVNGRAVDFDWFRDYYARYLMAFGVEQADKYFGITLNHNDNFVCKFEPDLKSYIGLSYNFKFIEFVEEFNFQSVTLSDLVQDYFVDNSTTFFNIKEKYKKIDFLNLAHVNDFDISNVVYDGAELRFSMTNPSVLTHIENLKMTNVLYNIVVNRGIVLVSNPNNAEVLLSFSGSGSLYVRNGCNLSNIRINQDKCYSLHICLEEGLSKEDIEPLFYNFRARHYLDVNLRYSKCKFSPNNEIKITGDL